MALANLISRRLKLLVGSDSQDWSGSRVSASLGYTSIDESGLIKIEGQIEIQEDLTNPESIDPRTNFTRWRPGQSVRLQIQRSDASYSDHPLGYLTLLREPAPPQQNRITLDVGCWLAWMDVQGPDGDQSGVSVGTSTNTATIAQSLLEADDVPNASINLGSWPYSLAVPVAKDGGSYTGVAGELAYSNDFRYLYVDKAGVVRSRQLSFTPGNPTVTITLGTNDSVFRPLGNPASPAEVYRADAVGTTLSALANPITDQNVETGDASTLGPGKSGSYTVTTNYTDSYTYNPPTAVSRTSQVQVLAPPELVYLDPEGVSGNTQSYLVTEVKTYDASSAPHRLLNIVKTIRRPQGAFNLNASPKTSDRTLTTITTTYTYTNDVVSKIVVEQDDLEILHDDLSANPYNTQTVRKSTQTWTPLGNGEFKSNTSNQVAAILSNAATDTTQTSLWALMVAPPSAPSPGGRGENAPPATEYWEGPFVEEEQQYIGQATFTHPGGSSGRTRTFPITVPFGFSNAQCTTMATLHRDLAVGEYRGMEIKIPITDALIDADFPLFQVDVIDGGTTYKFLANGVSWEHTPTESAVYCQGIWLSGGYTP
ncbi:MAG: hypothetical protein AAF215_05125 [Cyanobacteria bacterium P01_A01_bin.123]